MGILERIKDIELEMSRTQKNKATSSHLGALKARLCKLRSELLNPPKAAGSGPGEGFDVVKYGHGRVALIGFPSVGKSSLLSQLTGTESEALCYVDLLNGDFTDPTHFFDPLLAQTTDLL